MINYYTKEQVDAIAAIIGDRIKNETDQTAMRDLINALANTNFMTDAERTKLASLEESKFFGTYPDLASIPTVDAVEGMYAHIDPANGTDVIVAYYDLNDDKWVEQGAATTETAASIKTKYESNANTNAFTDALLEKLEDFTEAQNINDATAALDGAIA